MKLIEAIFARKRPEFDAYRDFEKKRQEATDKRNKIAAFVKARENRVIELTGALYKSPSDKAFSELVDAQIKADASAKCLTDTFASLCYHADESFKTSEEALEVLGNALNAFAEELEAEITKICTDARELSDRSGIEFSEPASVHALRAEIKKAREGADRCLNSSPGAIQTNTFSVYSPLIRISA